MSSLDLSQVGVYPELPSTPGPGPEQRHAAALAVCANATDVDDARDLLTVLGLLDQPAEAPAPAAPAEPRPARALSSTFGYRPWLDTDGLVKTCRNGHDYTAANTRWRRDSKAPQCRACETERRRKGNKYA